PATPAAERLMNVRRDTSDIASFPLLVDVLSRAGSRSPTPRIARHGKTPTNGGVSPTEGARLASEPTMARAIRSATCTESAGDGGSDIRAAAAAAGVRTRAPADPARRGPA